MNFFEGNKIEGIKYHISFGISERRLTNSFDTESYKKNNVDLEKISEIMGN